MVLVAARGVGKNKIYTPLILITLFEVEATQSLPKPMRNSMMNSLPL